MSIISVFAGLTLLPLTCGVATQVITYQTAARLSLRCRVVLLLVMDLARPPTPI